MERREFIKNTCLGCAGLVGLSSIASLLSSCSPLPSIMATPVNNTISIDALSFVAENKILVVKNKTMDYDILLVKKNDTQFNALYMQCSHENQPLTATKSSLHCASHGSAFDLDGNVTIQPATKKLKKFQTEIINNQIIIHLNKTIL